MSAETMSLLEKTARVIHQVATDSEAGPFSWEDFSHEARAALRALGVTEEQMAGPADAVVVVPSASAMTDEQAEAMCAVVGMCGGLAHTVYAAAIDARPGAPE